MPPALFHEVFSSLLRVSCTHIKFFSPSFSLFESFFASTALRCGDRLEKRDAIKMKLVPQRQRPQQKSAGYTQKIVFIYYQVFRYQHRLDIACWRRFVEIPGKKRETKDRFVSSLKPIIRDEALSTVIKSFSLTWKIHSTIFLIFNNFKL